MAHVSGFQSHLHSLYDLCLHCPTVHTLPRVICTLPVATSTCEHSISIIRRLKTYLRATMGQERMSGLALMHIHYDIQLDVDEIINRFARISPRRMALENMKKHYIVLFIIVLSLSTSLT